MSGPRKYSVPVAGPQRHTQPKELRSPVVKGKQHMLPRQLAACEDAIHVCLQKEGVTFPKRKIRRDGVLRRREVSDQALSIRLTKGSAMRRPDALVLAVFAALTMGSAMTASAFATSPQTVTLPGEGLPVIIKGENATAKTEFQSAAGTLKGTGLGLTMTVETASAGKFSFDFTNVEDSKHNKYNTMGDAAGVVLTSSNTFTLVNDVKAKEGVAALLNVDVTIPSPFLVTFKGTALMLLLPVGGGEKTTGFEGVLRCSGVTVGEPKEVNYWDAADTFRTALLSGNFGTGPKKACWEFQPNLALTASKMIEFTN
jgi:hypothetical protein